MEYTKGEWKIDRESDYLNLIYSASEDGKEHIIGQLSNGKSPYATVSETEADANAQLIVAAPELYEALKELSTIVLGVIEYHRGTPVILGMDSYTLQPSRQALAKAEGLKAEGA